MGLEGLACFHSKPGHERIHIRVGVHFGRIKVELSAPDKFGLNALLHNRFEEVAKHRQAIARADAGEAGVVRQGFVEIVPEIPSDAQAVLRVAHEEALRTNAFKKHHQLQFEKDFGGHRWSTAWYVGILHQIAHKRQIERAVQMSIKMVKWHQRLQRHGDEGSKRPFFDAHHSNTP